MSVFHVGVIVGVRVRRAVGMQMLVRVRRVFVIVAGIGVTVGMLVLRSVGVRMRVGMLFVLHEKPNSGASHFRLPSGQSLAGPASGNALPMHHQDDTVRPYELRAQSTKSLLARLYRQTSTLVSEELELAKTEFAQRAGLLSAAMRGYALALALGSLALACLCGAAIAALSIVLPIWGAALILAAGCGGAAIALAFSARTVLRRAAEPYRSSICGSLLTVKRDADVAGGVSRVESSRLQVGQTVSALEQKTDLVAPLRDTALSLGSLGVAMGAIVREGASNRPSSP